MWESQYKDTFGQLLEQQNLFVYSNVCLYILNIACNTSIVWLKSPKIITCIIAGQPHPL